MTRCLSVRLQLCAQMMEDALSAMEGNVALRLDRIEHRLESMELLVSLDIFPWPAQRTKKNHTGQPTLRGLSSQRKISLSTLQLNPAAISNSKGKQKKN